MGNEKIAFSRTGCIRERAYIISRANGNDNTYVFRYTFSLDI